MNTFLKMAWRNIWRNKRRAMITMASVFFAVFFALAMRSMQLGSYDNMERNIVELFNGYIQVHDSAYWENKSINNTLYYADSLHDILLMNPNVREVIPRLESFALASAGELTKGVMLAGIDPGPETALTGLRDRVIKGTYLEKDDDAVLLGQRLADYLKLDVNDTLVLLGQGYHGMSAAGKYPIKGIISFPNPQLDAQICYMPVAATQYFLSADNRLTALVLDIRDRDALNQTVPALQEAVGPAYRVMSWREMLPEVVQGIESDNASGKIMLGILYMVIAFGILGTVIMMTAERRKEMGVMVAVGFHRWKLAVVTAIETTILGLMGVLAGVSVSLPFLAYLSRHPIPATGEMKEMIEEYGMEALWVFSNDPMIYVNQAVIVVILTMLALIYPVSVILRLKPMQAIRD